MPYGPDVNICTLLRVSLSKKACLACSSVTPEAISFTFALTTFRPTLPKLCFDVDVRALVMVENYKSPYQLGERCDHKMELYNNSLFVNTYKLGFKTSFLNISLCKGTQLLSIPSCFLDRIEVSRNI